MSFFSATEHYFADMPDNVRSECMFSMEDVNITSDENFKMVYDYLFPLAIWKENVRKSIDAKKIDSFFRDSLMRCWWTKRRDTTGNQYLISSTLINTDQIKNVLLKNQGICFNPLYQINKWWDIVPMIWKPSLKLLKRLKFITPVYYSWTTMIKWYNVDLRYLEAYDTLNIQSNDIKEIYLWLYHPYIWWLIQNNNLSSLNHSF